MKAAAAARSSPLATGPSTAMPSYSTLGPFGPALLPQELEGDWLHQREAFQAGPERGGGFERQGRTVRMAHEVKRAFGLLGDGKQHVHVGIGAVGLLGRPRVRPSIADE